ncbi:MAG TPA: MerR family transcriptional regulator [Candidatus Dormibacteraeota bacterium]|nr:MerR family transcriptional regulator [Candidatus Dormibacteraeota bacterium]
MYFPAEHVLDRLQISAQQLSDWEEKEIVKGVARAGRVFYSSRDLYRLKGILLFMSRGLTLEEAQRRVDHPVEEGFAAESRR